MIILQTLNENSNLNVNWISSNFTNIITTIAVIINAIYVYFTIKTFNEIKKQTDLQLNAHLAVEAKIFKDNALKGNINKTYLDNDFSLDWKKSMQTAFPELSDPGLFDGVFYCLILSNYGNTEVKQIKFVFEVTIENYENVVTTKKLTPKETKKLSKTCTEVLRKGETITLPLFSTAAFPKFTIKLTGNYVDVRNQEYTILPIINREENSYLQ